MLKNEGKYHEVLQILKSILYSDKGDFCEAMKLIRIIGKLSIQDNYAVLCKLIIERHICHKRILFYYDTDAYGRKKNEIVMLCEDITAFAKDDHDDYIPDLAHEIRTSVNNLYGNLTLLKTQMYGNNRYLKNAFLSADYLLRLVNSVLSISEMKSDTRVANTEAITLEELLQYPKAIFEQAAADKDIELQILYEQPLYRYLYLNKEVIQQIIINLISNAIKYTNEGGQVLCRIWEEYLGEKRVKVFLEIKDSGIGMSEEFLTKNLSSAWENHAREGRKKGVSGNGLGLALTVRLIKLLHGDIRIHSHEEKGTRILVRLEADGENTLLNKEGKDNPVLLKRVLVAEDEEANMDIICGYLEQLGIETDKAYCGEKVKEMYIRSEEYYYDAVLLDINLPDISGIEVVETIRDQNRTDSGLPIIAVTADVNEKQKSDAVSAGISEYIIKPYRLEDISSALSKCLRR